MTFRRNEDSISFVVGGAEVSRCLEHYKQYSTILDLTFKLRTVKKERLNSLDKESLRVLYKASQTIVKELGLNE